ncbi:putative sterol carrier protein [Cytobacillus eiseniae]|uniref:Sterol carrier protein n=1 Tax=Cytobacillus eiseniae TaxID=762947 RepID=A0ABS4RBY8_9BACI|nr:SCP2 sterol-binding domain-containing protein [Cytobacillus eiseniae]MBP2240417.1 putative sterol carrier protein [Cytobacillus eiseniae]
MQEIADAFINELETKSHIGSLLSEASFSLCIRSDDEEIHLLFQNGGLTVYPAFSNNCVDVLLAGSKENIRSVLMGKERLRSAMNTRRVKVQSTFRKILFLESLFILSNT